MVKRVSIIGCPVDSISREDLLEKLCGAILARDRCQVLGPNAAFAVKASKDSSYRTMIEKATFLPADGYWLALAAKILGYEGVTHVGIERLVYDLLPRIAEMRGTIYLLGARDHIVRESATRVEEQYKGIKIVGLRNGYFAEADEEKILFEINKADPDIVLLGMASPKKERWMAKYKDLLKAPVTIGVGGLFDVIAGQVPPAPYWVKDIGFEWLFRFMHDPKRLWKRYTVGNAKFIWMVFKEWIKTRSSFKTFFKAS
jgi:N-acetylglucosaminyldiphosphoundecaprenol N-acetyl-beta-D-mannosaminyltransferase